MVYQEEKEGGGKILTAENRWASLVGCSVLLIGLIWGVVEDLRQQ